MKTYRQRPPVTADFPAMQFDGSRASAEAIIAWLGDDGGFEPYSRIRDAKGGAVGLFVMIDRNPYEVHPTSWVYRLPTNPQPSAPIGDDRFNAVFMETPSE